MEKDKLNQQYNRISELLKAEMNAEGFWTGRLSTSALSTAVAIVALKTINAKDDQIRIGSGLNWLLNNIGTDGGYGDTPESVSNVSTTLLCYSAITFCQQNGSGAPVLKRMENWLRNEAITLDPGSITGSILKFYGSDYTFSLPILAMLHLAGVIPSSALKEIPGLPFELTLLPQSLYRFFNLRVVSYALPALIGVGIYLHKMRPAGLLNLKKYRNVFINPAIRKLDGLVPESGGFLEAIPLTGFVAMCLIESGLSDNVTVRKGSEFLRRQQRDDGGWPIDTDLSTWVTTLSVKAFGKDLNNRFSEEQSGRIRRHLLDLQYKTIHPFNGAQPGGWGWTSFSGSVPDADDTPGAILALLELYSGSKEENEAILNGCLWLTGLQNSDGGFPTFCRGWGRLPFDKSCADLTGHALLALLKSLHTAGLSPGSQSRTKIEKAVSGALSFLEKHQNADGSWLPLWFGNQQTEDQTNPVYGTAKVCIYINDCLNIENINNKLSERLKRMALGAQEYLLSQQNTDGSWGGKKGVPGTIEESSLAVSALATKNRESCLNGMEWLSRQKDLKASPIGLYFALLWYDEKMYPIIYYAEALRRIIENEK